jgi:hypothetical protein
VGRALGEQQPFGDHGLSRELQLLLRANRFLVPRRREVDERSVCELDGSMSCRRALVLALGEHVRADTSAIVPLLWSRSAAVVT